VLIDSPRRTTPSWASGLPGHPLGTPSPLSPRGTSARSVPQGRPVIMKVLLSAPCWTNDLYPGGLVCRGSARVDGGRDDQPRSSRSLSAPAGGVIASSGTMV
jgi:hypothetical protein